MVGCAVPQPGPLFPRLQGPARASLKAACQGPLSLAAALGPLPPPLVASPQSRGFLLGHTVLSTCPGPFLCIFSYHSPLSPLGGRTDSPRGFGAVSLGERPHGLTLHSFPLGLPELLVPLRLLNAQVLNLSFFFFFFFFCY